MTAQTMYVTFFLRVAGLLCSMPTSHPVTSDPWPLSSPSTCCSTCSTSMSAASVQRLKTSDNRSDNQSFPSTPNLRRAPWCVHGPYSQSRITAVDARRPAAVDVQVPEALVLVLVRPMARHSKLQKQILNLYRHFLRAGRDKPGFVPRIRDEFRENAGIKKTDVMHVEYLLRRGQRQLEQLRDNNTKQLGSFSRPDLRAGSRDPD
ncbi:Succinate dehydrogenase assembly factor 1, mitochondrial [Liparis tanakae]|uniref:Succinate dehydrogenase assembly factor 1, mitochondrial n=1 Tax=Liparis tanakae TaxID=230148 RepID=A0A4Z2GFD5_9TELE|nr:Succinate dehydrogenase assembly factor 1, mitochondrial [Liparis tanakae]